MGHFDTDFGGLFVDLIHKSRGHFDTDFGGLLVDLIHKSRVDFQNNPVTVV